jgi:NAD-dependent deacetylase
MQPINVSPYHNIVILTGAGVSVASGIRPFRGAGGLWQDLNPLDYSDVSLLKTNPAAIWQLHSDLRRQLVTAQPNPAHSALAALESRLSPNQHFTLITQNIDGLH